MRLQRAAVLLVAIPVLAWLGVSYDNARLIHHGRVVLENEQLQTTTIGTFELSGDPKAHTVSLTVATKHITMTFTNDPVEP